MKTFYLLAISLFLSINTFAQEKYSSSDGKFSAIFPAAVEELSQDIDVDGQSSQMKSYTSIDENANVFVVAYIEYSENYFSDKNAINVFMDNTVEGFFNEIGIVPIDRKDVKNGKNKGIEYRGQNDKYSVVYRIFVVKSTVFQLVSLGGTSYPDDAITKAFFKSVKFL